MLSSSLVPCTSLVMASSNRVTVCSPSVLLTITLAVVTLPDFADLPIAPHLLHLEIVEFSGSSLDLQALQERYSSYHRTWSISPRTVMSFVKCGVSSAAGSTASRISVVSSSVQSAFAARNLAPC